MVKANVPPRARSKAKEKGAETDLVERLACDINVRLLKWYNDELTEIALKHGWRVYWLVVGRHNQIQQEMMAKKTNRLDGSPYHLLGLTENAEDEVVRFAYIALVKKVHPDLHPDGDGKMMGKINVAYQQISLERGWKVIALPEGRW